MQGRTVQVLRYASGGDCSRAGDAWQGGLFLGRSSTSPESTLPSFQMMAFTGASKYLPSPKATLLLLVPGEQWLMDAKNQHLWVCIRRRIYMHLGILSGELNSMRLTPASSNNRVLAFCPHQCWKLVFEHFPFILCRYIRVTTALSTG